MARMIKWSLVGLILGSIIGYVIFGLDCGLNPFDYGNPCYIEPIGSLIFLIIYAGIGAVVGLVGGLALAAVMRFRERRNKH